MAVLRRPPRRVLTAAPPAPPAAAASISDDFEDGVISASWVTSLATESGGRLTATADGAIPADAAWAAPLNLQGSSIFWQCPVIVGSACWGFGNSTWIDDRLEFFGFYNLNADGVTFRCTQISGGGFTGAAVDITIVAGSWMRLREAGGTVFWDTSPDGVTWTQRHSRAFAPSYLTNGIFGGITVSADSGYTVSFDSLNIAGSGETTVTDASILSSAQVATTGAAPNLGGGNAHGSFQNKGVSTPVGDFVVWMNSGTSNQKTVSLKWRRGAQTWSSAPVVWTGGPGTEEAPHVLHDPASGRIFVVIWPSTATQPNSKPNVYHAIPNTTDQTWTPTLDNGGAAARYNVFGAYLGAGVMNNGSLVFVAPFGAGGAVMEFDIWIRSPAGVWNAQRIETASIGGRFAYPHVWPSRTGNGCWIVGSRDRTWAEAGLTQPAGDSFNFVFDGVSATYCPDVTIATPTWTHTLIDTQAQLSTSERPECIAAYMGAFVDLEGRLHVATQKTRNSGAYGNPGAIAPSINHVIVGLTGNTPTVLATGAVPNISGSGLAGYGRFVENLAGSLFFFYQQSASQIRVTSYPTRSSTAPGTTWSGLSQGASHFNGFKEFSRRSGSKATSAPLIEISASNGADVDVFQLQLPTG